MKLTLTEKVVFATVFANRYDAAIRKGPPTGVAAPGNEKAWEEWEQGEATSAVEGAGCAVMRLRELEECVAEGYEDTDTQAIYRAALDRG